MATVEKKEVVKDQAPSKKRSSSSDFRIEGVTLPNKRLCIALTYVYGIGRTTAAKICDVLKIDQNRRPNDLNDEELTKIREYVKAHCTVEGELKKVVITNIQRKIALNCYQGLRHKYKLPVRGQRTRTNARTRKGKSSPIANKKKVTK